MARVIYDIKDIDLRMLYTKGGRNAHLGTLASSFTVICGGYLLYLYNCNDEYLYKRYDSRILEDKIEAIRKWLSWTRIGLEYARNTRQISFPDPRPLHCLNALQEMFCIVEENKVDETIEIVEQTLEAVRVKQRDFPEGKVKDVIKFFEKLREEALNVGFNTKYTSY